MSGPALAAAVRLDGDGTVGFARFDPRVRLVLALAFAAVLPVISAPAALAAALLVALVAVAAARLHWRAVLIRLAAVEAFMLALILTLPFAVPGEPVLTIAGLSASAEGFIRTLVIMLRVNAAALTLLALLSGLGAIGLARAMAGLGLPHSLADLTLLTVRYIGLLGDEYRRLARAMRVRGFAPGSNRHTWRSYGNLIGMLLVRSLERAERVRWAMLCRGFSGIYATSGNTRLATRDLALAGIGVAAMIFLLALEWTE